MKSLKRYRKYFYTVSGESRFIDVDFPPLIEDYIENDYRGFSVICDIALKKAFGDNDIERIEFLVKLGMFKNNPDTIRYAIITYFNKTKEIIRSGEKECLYY